MYSTAPVLLWSVVIMNYLCCVFHLINFVTIIFTKWTVAVRFVTLYATHTFLIAVQASQLLQLDQ